MSQRPPIAYRLGRRQTVVPDQGLWNQFLPDTRFGDAVGVHRLTYGQYFKVVAEFLGADDFATVCHAAGRNLKTDIHPSDIQSIDISLEKHGQFTHPARVAVDIDQRRSVFVVNLAVTPSGRDCLKADVALLDRLGSAFPYRFVPRVFRSETLKLSGTGVPVTLALGEWLQNYCEFHLTQQSDGAAAVALWHPLQGRTLLSPSQTDAVFRNAAKLLTAYFNIETFEHIADWHLAAGDFVARAENRSPDVRLITVRRYTPLLEGVATDSESAFHGAVLFMLKISLRLRLDRVDGVGDMACIGDEMVDAVVAGFFEGLALQVQTDRLPPVFVELMRDHLAAMPAKDMAALTAAVFQHCGFSAEERSLLEPRLAGHAACLRKACRRK